jgi:hypothetical protein
MQGPNRIILSAADKPFLDIPMPPYQDRNDRNKRNKNIKKVAKRDPLYIDGQAPRLNMLGCRLSAVGYQLLVSGRQPRAESR